MSEPAWQALQRALEVHEPSCVGDDRFITDTPSESALAAMAALCAACPVLAQCAAFARRHKTHQIAGFWAGRQRGLKRKAKLY